MLKNFFLEIERFSHHPLSYLAIFVIAVTLTIYLQFSPHLADPDSFYHAKMALLLADRGPVTALPWLTATNLADQFTDHHLLYHYALIPFVKFFPPLIGLKIATVLFATAVVLTFYWLLKRLDIVVAFWFTLILLASQPFIFRINLAKAQSLAFVFLFIFLYLLVKRQWPWLFGLSWLYVWLYGGWPVLWLLAAIYSLALIFFEPDRARIKKAGLVIGAVSLGLLAGLVINPYFPQNLNFYTTQIWEIAVINYKATIGVGGEWYGFKPLDLLGNASFVFSALIIALVFFPSIRQRRALGWFGLTSTVLFYVLTLKSRRNVEYFVPLAIFWAGWAITAAIKEKKFQPEFNMIGKFLKNSKAITVLIVIFFTLSLPYIIIRDVFTTGHQYHNSFSLTKYQGAANWLEQNSEPKSVVFHSDWDEFPILFYYNHQSYYLVGLDPTFMFQADPDKYWDWYLVTTGGGRDRLYDIISREFNAQYVFIDRAGHEGMEQNIANNFKFQQVYQDSETALYLVL